MNDFFATYMSKHDNLIDYFLIDYAISVGYDNIPAIKEMIDGVF
jgi:hypothetical protein